MSRGRGFGRGKPQYGPGQEVTAKYEEIPLYPPRRVNTFQPADLQHDFETRFAQEMRKSVYYVEEEKLKPLVERYSDRFVIRIEKPDLVQFLQQTTPDLSLYPSELHTIFGKSKIEKQITDKTIDFDKFKDGEQEEPEENEEDEVMEDESDDENDYVDDHYDEDRDAFGEDED
ncbi:hypothetical protein EDD86DRAFT_276056 [Gorgonomyces haynaldii]|nr:hypothetical protein EDD86DRAFT_276056 [Gorgonomyces haynaldii]